MATRYNNSAWDGSGKFSGEQFNISPGGSEPAEASGQAIQTTGGVGLTTTSGTAIHTTSD